MNTSIIEARGIWDTAGLETKGKCPACAFEGSQLVVSRDDGLPIQQCGACLLAYVDPRPGSKQLSDYYANGYFSGEKDFFKGKDYCRERDEAIGQQAVTGYKEIVSNLEIKDKTVLDVGCASGALLQALRSSGPRELIGVDSAEYPVSFGKANYNLDLRCETIESADLADEYFDLITMIDVIEHVEDLKAFLSNVRRILKPAGAVFVSTPNYDSYYLARDDWSCLYQDFEHLQYFSKQSLSSLFSGFGMEMVKCWNNSLPFRLREYPILHRYALHQVLHPGIAFKNGWTKLNHKLVRNPDRAGLILNAIFRRPAA
jgi:2-polyprenyl-3-methyl-5-hydroxy-6-metoxy-1,4-benzoquinol methylase